MASPMIHPQAVETAARRDGRTATTTRDWGRRSVATRLQRLTLVSHSRQRPYWPRYQQDRIGSQSDCAGYAPESESWPDPSESVTYHSPALRGLDSWAVKVMVMFRRE